MESDGPNSKQTQLNPANYQQIPNILINDVAKGVLAPVDIVVYAILRNHLGENQFVWPSNETLARLAGYSARHIKRCLDRLETAGHISRMGKSIHGTKKTYILTRVSKNGSIICGKRPDGEQKASPEAVTPQSDAADPQRTPAKPVVDQESPFRKMLDDPELMAEAAAYEKECEARENALEAQADKYYERARIAQEPSGAQNEGKEQDAPPRTQAEPTEHRRENADVAGGKSNETAAEPQTAEGLDFREEPEPYNPYEEKETKYVNDDALIEEYERTKRAEPEPPIQEKGKQGDAGNQSSDVHEPPF